MEIAYLHLITNHIPIIGVPFALFLLALGVWRKSDELKTASFLIFVFLGFATLSVFFSGRGGEDFIEKVAGVSETAIGNHEDFAIYALICVEVIALFSLFAILRYRGFRLLRFKSSNDKRMLAGLVSETTLSNYPAWVVLSILVLSLLSTGLLGYTGKLGGAIRHSEFYSSNQKAPQIETPSGAAEAEGDDDD